MGLPRSSERSNQAHRLHRGGYAGAVRLSHEILNANPAFLDDAPLEERRAQRRDAPDSPPDLLGQVGALDPAAIEGVRESWPVVRDPMNCMTRYRHCGCPN